MLTICIDGVNGVGKDTIIEQLNTNYILKGKKVLNLREPDDIGGLKIKDYIRRTYTPDEVKYYSLTGRINTNNPSIDNFTRLFLFLASRSNNLANIQINDDLDLNDLCFINRFTLSTLVYNVKETNYSLEKMYELERSARLGYIPDLVYYLYEEPNEIYQRELKREYKYLNTIYGSDEIDKVFNIYKNITSNRIKTIKNLLDRYDKAINFLVHKENWNIIQLKNSHSLETYNYIIDDIDFRL